MPTRRVVRVVGDAKVSVDNSAMGFALEIGALHLRDLMRDRAFPVGGDTTRSSSGALAPDLSPAYARLKTRRGRHPVSNQRLTSRTANAFGIIDRKPLSRTLGFARNRDIASYLQDRNDWFPATADEERRTIDKILESMEDLGVGEAKVSKSTILFRIPT